MKHLELTEAEYHKLLAMLSGDVERWMEARQSYGIDLNSNGLGTLRRIVEKLEALA